MASSNSFSALVHEELSWVTSNKKMLGFLFIIPTVILLFISAIYTIGSARDLPVAVIDYDQSYISRLLAKSIDATGAMKVIDGNNQTKTVTDYFLANNVYGVFVIPKGFEADVKHGNKTGVQFYKSSFNLIVSNALLSEANTAVRSISAGIFIQKMQSKGFTGQQALCAAKPVRVNITTLYNPFYNYEVFMVYPVYLAILQIIIAVAGVFLGNQYRRRLFAKEHAPFNTMHLMGIAGIAAFFVTAINVIVSFIINRYLFGVELPGFGIAAFFLIFVYMYVLFTAGNVAGMLLTHRESAVQVIIFFLTPAFILSGYTYPIWGMPKLVQLIAELSPFTHFLRGFISTAYMEETAIGLRQSGILLVLLGVTLLAQAVVLYRKRRTE